MSDTTTTASHRVMSDASTAPVRLTLARKVMLLAVLVAAGTAAVFTVVDTRSVATLAERKSMEALTGQAEILVPYISKEFENLRRELAFLALTPPIQGLARSRKNGDIDPADGSSTELWRDRLATIFSSLMLARPGYTQIRLIGLADDGRELVRVDRRAAGPVVIEGDALQQKGGRPYFQAALGLAPETIAMSNIDFNMDNGVIADDAPITIRAMTLVHDEEGEPFAVLIINEDYVRMLDRVASATSLRSDLHIVDGVGNHYRNQATGRSEFHFADDPTSPFADLAAGISETAEPVGTWQRATPSGERILLYRTALADGPLGLPVRVALDIDQEQLFAEASELKKANYVLSAAAVCMALVLGWISGHLLVGPVKQLRQSLVDYEKGKPLDGLPTQTDDEIGDFARSFEAFGNRLKATRDSERRAFLHLDAIMENSIEGMLTVDADGVVRRVNRACLDILEMKKGWLDGRPYEDILTASSVETVRAGFEAVMKGEHETRGFVCEVVGSRGDGTTMDLELSMSRVPLPDEYAIVAVFVRDIEERKKAERELKSFAERLESSNEQLESTNSQLSEVNEDLRGFAYIVSHDLRAPLVNLMGFSAELKKQLGKLESGLRSNLSEDQFEPYRDALKTHIPKALDFINSSADKMQRQLDIVLRLSRLGRYELAPKLIDLGSLFRAIASQHQGDGQFIEVDLDDTPDIRVDEDAMRIVATNLISNAVKYRHPERDPKIEVSAEWTDEELTLCVADNGRGMRAEDLEEIYKLFRRVGRQDTQGEGIGLAFVRRVLDRVGGAVRCESELDGGTRFYVTLPRKGMDESREAA